MNRVLLYDLDRSTGYARDLVEEDIIPGVKRAGLYELVKMIKASDKVLTFTEGI